MNPASEPKSPEPVPPTTVAPPQATASADQAASEPPLVPPPFSHPPTAAAPKLFLAATGLAVVAWLAWLSVTALNKSRDPVVSRAQAAIAPIAVVAKVKSGKDGKPDPTVNLVKSLSSKFEKSLEGPLLVTNLPTASGFDGDGEYLLLLSPEANAFLPDDSPVFQLAHVRTTATDTDPPVIYKWSADVEKQAERLYRGK